MSSPPAPGPVRSPSVAAERGFTLIEALVALAVLGLAMSLVVQIASLTLRIQSASSRHLEAAVVAEARLNDLTVLADDSLAAYAPGRTGSTVLDTHRYRWATAVQRITDVQGLWRLAVRVDWEGGDFEVSTLVYRRGGVPVRGVGP